MPQHDAGMRIDPPPSPPPATGTIPLATAAAEPPLEPAVVRSGFHGFRAGPKSSGSVKGVRPNSGVFVLPTTIAPVARTRLTYSLSCGATKSRKSRLPLVMRSPPYHDSKSLSRIGTPLNAPSGNAPSAARRAAWYILCTTALSAGLRRSMRSMADSTNSFGLTSPLRTSAARPKPS